MRPLFFLAAVALGLCSCGVSESSSPSAPAPDAEVPVSSPPPVDSMPCTSRDELEGIHEALQSGLPTYDYEPAVSLDELAAAADVVISGSIDSAVRGDGYAAGRISSATLLSVSNVEVISGSGDVEKLAQSSGWPQSDAPDPLAEPVTFDGLRFVAFVERFEGFWVPWVDGMVLGCEGSEVAAVPFVAPPPEADGLTVDEFADVARSAASIPPAAEEARRDTPLPCQSTDDLAAITDVLHAGFPAYDYDAADDLIDLIESTDVTVIGTIASVARESRGTYDDGSDQKRFVLSIRVAGVEAIAGSGDVQTLVTDSGGTPFDPIEMSGVRFVAFGTQSFDEPTEFVPAIDGFVFGCDGSQTPARALIDSPPNTVGFTVEMVSGAAREAAATVINPTPGPVFTHPNVGTSNEGLMAEVGGVLDLDAGCLRFVGDDGSGTPVVWPGGTTWDPATEAVVLPDGERIVLGEFAIGSGGYFTSDIMRRAFEPEIAEPLIACAVDEFAEVAVVNNFPGAIGPA